MIPQMGLDAGSPLLIPDAGRVMRRLTVRRQWHWDKGSGLEHARIARTRTRAPERAHALSRAHSRSRAPSLMLGQRSWSATIRIRARLHVCTRDTYTYHACYLDAPALGHGDGGREGGMGTEISCAFYAIRNCRLGPSSCSPLHVCADLTGQPGFLEAGLVPPKVPIIGAAR